MDDVFDLLQKNNLTNDENVEEIIMNQWNATRLLNFKDTLLELIKAIPLPQTEFGFSDYSFFANSNMSAQSYGGCIEMSCRLSRVDALARFAALYSDCVYIQNYFWEYEHATAELFDNYSYRDNFVCDLKMILRLKPLLAAGVIRFSPGINLCQHCHEQFFSSFKDFDIRLEKHIRTLEKQYADRTSATLYHCEVPPNIPEYFIEIHGDEDIIEHGEAILAYSQLPHVLQVKPHSLERVPLTQGLNLSKGLSLSKEKIRRTGVIRALLIRVARDVWMQYLYTRKVGLNLKYLTNRNIDVSFLRAVTEDDEFKRYDDVLRSNLVYEMPILEGLPLAFVLDIRKKEHDAFLIYRDALNEIINQYILQRKALSPLDAKEIYQDLVQPRLNYLNRRIKSIRNSYFKKSAERMFIAIGSLTVGLCSNIFTPTWASILSALGIAQATEGTMSIIQACSTPEDIRNDNLYFLWKLSKKSK